MPFALFKNENVAQGLPKNGQFQAGVSNFDSGVVVEQGVKLPWAAIPEASWVYYDVAVVCHLDSGIVVHRRMPGVDNGFDTLASFDVADPRPDQIIDKGVNLVSKDQFADIVQRMGHARYWFNLVGQALRVGYQVPIPGIKVIAGVPAIPDDSRTQLAFNKIIGNYSGAPLWHAKWSLWYTVAVPPKSAQMPPANLAAHISGDAKLPDGANGIQAPFSQPDDAAQTTQPLQLQTGIIQP